MSFFIRENNQYKRFISPPVTPKQDTEACFLKSNIMEQYNASTLPLSPPSYPMTSPLHRRRESSFDSSSSGHTIASQQNKRKQSNPSRSPPSTTDGAFRMPLDILAKALNVVPNPQSYSTPFNAPVVSSSLPLPKDRKRKRGNDCITPIIEALEQEADRKEQQEKIDVYHCTSRKRNSAFALSSLLLPTPLPALQEPSQFDAPPVAEPPTEFSKKSGTGAAHIYENLSADCDQATLFLNSEEWIPSLEVFNRRPTIRVSWKGSPLKIKTMPYYDKLHPGEATIAATLRLTPEQYLKCKWALVLAAKEADETGALFRKSEAQKVCCIDVNKTSVLWNAFGRLGWLGSKWPQ
ncbi:hypothetical protein MAM1_0466c10634 [Mucor ambiguus]|uniref:SWIRM domain-containing protein n=1 Tax=Mucor ambiguus TaxID=91626 RepID=A0A0C9MUG3_9FUNG|nr:hypothetical protein MAM1_0466c10634 [Mucor ambiguus]